MEQEVKHKYLVLCDDAQRVYWTTDLSMTSANDIVFDVTAMRERSYDTSHKWKAIKQRGSSRAAEQPMQPSESGEWICEQCGHVNVARLKICFECGHPRFGG